jgi:hypothetical protein
MRTKNAGTNRSFSDGPDWEQAERFVELLAGESDPVMAFQVFDDKNAHPEWAAYKHGRLSDPEMRKWLARKNMQGCGVYVCVNATDGKGRRRANIKAARANWIDLDGTPLPATWPLEPDIINESSRGRFQVFWIIKPTTDLNLAADNQARLAAYFRADPKMTDPARVCRVPGFFHHKAKPFRSHTIESVDFWSDHARHAPQAIADSHPCDYGAPSPRSQEGRSDEPEAGFDNGVDVQRAREFLCSAPPSIQGQRGNANAYIIACKLNDFGISPEKSLELMLNHWNERCEPPWDAEGLETIIGNATTYKENSAGADSVANDFAEPSDTPKKPKIEIDDWVWIVGAMVFVHEDGQRMYNQQQFKSMFGHLRPKSDIVTAINRGSVGIRKFESLVYIPRADHVVEHNGRPCFNIWRPSGLEPKKGDHQWFLNHVRYMFPDEQERGLVLDFMAHLIQHPEVKMHFAMLIQSDQGLGKGAVGTVLRRMIGSRNCVEPANDEVTATFTGWQEGAQLAIINELMALGRLDVINRLKSPITDPVLRIHKKFGNPYTIPNHLNFLCFTNHIDSIPIGTNDRRWLVLFSKAIPNPPAYYAELFRKIESDDAVAAVLHYLTERAIKLNPKGVAPMTAAKAEMQELTLPEVEAYLRERFVRREPPFEFDLIRSEDVMEAIPLEMAKRQKNVRAMVLKCLGEMKAQRHDRHTSGTAGPAWQLWSIDNHERWKAAGAAERIRVFQDWHNIFAEETGGV